MNGRAMLPVRKTHRQVHLLEFEGRIKAFDAMYDNAFQGH
jgi:hypothetical protein